ncbi:MAG: NifB/NifX family molybdenum-iron cluster-binding protein, partial [Actinomycetota bacterium]
MRIAVSSSGPDLDSAVDPRFGRCAFLIFVETETMDYEAMQNSNASAGGGAGISTAQVVADKGIEAVITGNVGPNAYGVLNQAGITTHTGAAGTVRQAVESFKAGGFGTTQSPT